jgi:glycerol uptake facilitator-like aquaporin
MSEIKKKSLVELALTYGIILGLLRMLLDFSYKFSDAAATSYYVGYIIAFVAEVIVIVMAIKAFRNKYNGGLLKFSEAVKIGIIMMIMVAIFMIISGTFINPEYALDKQIELVEKYNPDQLEATMEQINNAKENPNYVFSFAMAILYYVFLGFVISAITGAVMRRSEDEQY